MDIKRISNNGLIALHNAIHRALRIDDATPLGIDKPLGVRYFADWREWSQWLEVELTARSLSFAPVPCNGDLRQRGHQTPLTRVGLASAPGCYYAVDHVDVSKVGLPTLASGRLWRVPPTAGLANPCPLATFLLKAVPIRAALSRPRWAMAHRHTPSMLCWARWASFSKEPSCPRHASPVPASAPSPPRAASAVTAISRCGSRTLRGSEPNGTSRPTTRATASARRNIWLRGRTAARTVRRTSRQPVSSAIKGDIGSRRRWSLNGSAPSCGARSSAGSGTDKECCERSALIRLGEQGISENSLEIEPHAPEYIGIWSTA